MVTLNNALHIALMVCFFIILIGTSMVATDVNMADGFKTFMPVATAGGLLLSAWLTYSTWNMY